MKVRWHLITLFLVGLAMVSYPLYQAAYPNIKALEPMSIMPMPTEQGTPVTDPTPSPTPSPSPTATPTLTPSPTPVPPPDFLVSATYTYSHCINYRMTTGEYMCLTKNPDARPLQNKEQVRQFMEWDDTSSLKYGTYFTCGHAAKRVHDNAHNNSIQCYIVALKFSSTYWHSIVMFPTKEDGDVYVESLGYDKWGYVTQGEKYRCSPMQHTNSYNLGGFNINYPVIEWTGLY